MRSSPPSSLASAAHAIRSSERGSAYSDQCVEGQDRENVAKVSNVSFSARHDLRALPTTEGVALGPRAPGDVDASHADAEVYNGEVNMRRRLDGGRLSTCAVEEQPRGIRPKQPLDDEEGDVPSHRRSVRVG